MWSKVHTVKQTHNCILTSLRAHTHTLILTVYVLIKTVNCKNVIFEVYLPWLIFHLTQPRPAAYTCTLCLRHSLTLTSSLESRQRAFVVRDVSTIFSSKETLRSRLHISSSPCKHWVKVCNLQFLSLKSNGWHCPTVWSWPCMSPFSSNCVWTESLQTRPQNPSTLHPPTLISFFFSMISCLLKLVSCMADCQIVQSPSRAAHWVRTYMGNSL